VLPQSLLGFGRVRAQRRAFGAFSTSVEVLRQKKPPPHPLLGKEGEETQHTQIQTDDGFQNTSPQLWELGTWDRTESWMNGAGKMHPQVLAPLSDVFERRGEIAPDPLESRPPPVAGWSRRDG
jgi:hypothetical protein